MPGARFVHHLTGGRMADHQRHLAFVVGDVHAHENRRTPVAVAAVQPDAGAETVPGLFPGRARQLERAGRDLDRPGRGRSRFGQVPAGAGQGGTGELFEHALRCGGCGFALRGQALEAVGLRRGGHGGGAGRRPAGKALHLAVDPVDAGATGQQQAQGEAGRGQGAAEGCGGAAHALSSCVGAPPACVTPRQSV